MISLFYVTIYLVQNMQHLRVNFGGIGRFKLGFFICFLSFLLKKSGPIFKSPVAALHSAHRNLTPRALYALTCNANISVFVRDHVMHPNTSVNLVNEHY